MKIELNKAELSRRIEMHRERLEDDEYYQICEVFSPADYDWYGDKEGRALLAFVSHYKINGVMIPCMEQMLEKMPEYTNDDLYFGPKAGKMIHEQQLSGHSWLLRGLCEHYEAFRDDFSLRMLRSVTEKLYLPLSGRIKSYPVERENDLSGDVSGHANAIIGNWILSSDVGCAFMSIDGVSHVYKITRDERVKALVDEMIAVYSAIDKYSLRAQTHCTLSAARGMMRMYECTGSAYYLNCARDIYELYVHGGGMTYVYQNLNWWQRPDTWTEPCAVVDSLMLALELYKAERKEEYRQTAVRIYINGFASLQRDNGCAGTDCIVCGYNGIDSLHILSYEVKFCCTMRLAEGLWYIHENADLLYGEEADTAEKNSDGIYMCGDHIYAEINDIGKEYVEKTVTVDGHELSPLLKFFKLPYDVIVNVKQKIVFK